MKYMLLIYAEESAWAALSPDQVAQEMGAYFAYSDALGKAGVMVGGDELQPVATAKTVAVRGGAAEVVDGPFADIKEALGGYYLIECESMEDAVRWAAQCPGARHGRVEVRPVMAH
ncbi:MAG: YciI family protein [Hyphomonadaceae bacterium]|nr:YciI family protein [Hyphomonadaceae bacterium]MBX3510645.1 YciI family protein [Hyphomonadaceae bacterium]